MMVPQKVVSDSNLERSEWNLRETGKKLKWDLGTTWKDL